MLAVQGKASQIMAPGFDLISPHEFLPVFYRDFLLRSKKQCRHYLILPGNIRVSLGGAGVITQPILQMSEIKQKVK